MAYNNLSCINYGSALFSNDVKTVSILETEISTQAFSERTKLIMTLNYSPTKKQIPNLKPNKENNGKEY